MENRDSNAVITVVGTDQVGIISKVSSYFADENINIVDISQTILSGSFVMMMMVDYSAALKKIGEIKQDLVELGESLNVSINLLNQKVFSAMHRI